MSIPNLQEHATLEAVQEELRTETQLNAEAERLRHELSNSVREKEAQVLHEMKIDM